MNGYKMNFNVGDRVSKNDIIAERMPQDLGRIRMMLNLGNVMTSSAKRYIPMTIEKADLEADTPYMVFAGYIATDDMIDSKMIMQVKDGFIMQDGNTAHDTPISIPISGLEMEIFAFYEYREDDDLDIAVRNPVHAMSRFHYASSHTYTNTYSLRENDRITLIKALDHARGFLDVYEREDIWTPPDWEDPISRNLTSLIRRRFLRIIPRERKTSIRRTPRTTSSSGRSTMSGLRWMSPIMIGTTIAT